MTCYKKAESASCIDHITALKGKDFIVLLSAYPSFASIFISLLEASMMSVRTLVLWVIYCKKKASEENSIRWMTLIWDTESQRLSFVSDFFLRRIWDKVFSRSIVPPFFFIPSLSSIHSSISGIVFVVSRNTVAALSQRNVLWLTSENFFLFVQHVK